MSDPAQLSQVAEMAPHDEADHAEHIHLPGPSFWPISLAVGIILIAMGFVTHLAVASAGGLIMVGAMAGWIAETRKQARELEGREGPPPYVHTVLFQYMAPDEGQINRSNGLRSQIDQHLLAIKQMPGFVDSRILRTHNYEGPVQTIIQTTWRDAERLAEYEESGATIESVIKAHKGVVVPGSVQVYDLQDVS
ncbi:MAG: hypothetical protein WEB00_08680 [Dehalococcoidia bacterium]